AHVRGDATAPLRVTIPCHAHAAVDAQLAGRQPTAVEAEPLRAVEPAPANQCAPAIARQHVPEHLLAGPRAAVLRVGRGGQDAVRRAEAGIDGTTADAGGFRGTWRGSSRPARRRG